MCRWPHTWTDELPIQAQPDTLATRVAMSFPPGTADGFARVCQLIGSGCREVVAPQRATFVDAVEQLPGYRGPPVPTVVTRRGVPGVRVDMSQPAALNAAQATRCASLPVGVGIENQPTSITGSASVADVRRLSVYWPGRRYVSLIRNVDDELAVLTAGIGRALELTAGTAHAAGQVATRAAGSGFAGIAQRMAEVRDAVQALHGHIAGIDQSIGEARSPVTRVPDQLSPQDTIEVLGPVVRQVDAVQTAIGAAIAKVGEIRQRTAAALQGGQPGPLLQRLDVIRQVLSAVLQRCGTAKQHVDTALAEVRRVGTAGN